MSREPIILLIVSTTLILSGCFDKDVQCSINNLEINSDLLDLPREDIIVKLGFPTKSDLAIKNFDEYSYIYDNKAYGLVIRYRKDNGNYYVLSHKCIKVNPRVEISNLVIWH